MKKILLLLGLVIVFSITLVNSGAYLSIENIYDNNYVAGSIDDNPDNVAIFPNPVIDNKLTISAENSIMMIEILDIVGGSVYIQKYEAGTNKVVLSLESFNKGLYIIKVKLNDKSTFTEKIMIK